MGIFQSLESFFRLVHSYFDHANQRYSVTHYLCVFTACSVCLSQRTTCFPKPRQHLLFLYMLSVTTGKLELAFNRTRLHRYHFNIVRATGQRSANYRGWMTSRLSTSMTSRLTTLDCRCDATVPLMGLTLQVATKQLPCAV